jgi:hypothetical protein
MVINRHSRPFANNLTHYCPVDRERTVSKHLMQNGFLAIWRGVDLKLAAVSQTLFRGGAAHVLRKDGIRAADGLLALEYIFAARDALWWRLRRANVSVCRAVSGHGVRPSKVAGGEPEGGVWEALMASSAPWLAGGIVAEAAPLVLHRVVVGGLIVQRHRQIEVTRRQAADRHGHLV